MRKSISKSDMERYLAKSLSVDELKEFEERLREAGLDADVDRPSPSEMLEALRPTPYEELFDDDALLAYVKGETDARTAAAIEQLRKVDSDLNETLLTMEGAKRQVEASLQLGRPSPALAPKRSWLSFAPWGLGLAAAAGLAILLLLPRQVPPAPGIKHVPTIDSVLSTDGFSTVAILAPTAKSALENPAISMEADARQALAALDTPTRDIAKMTPSRCLVLQSGTTKLTWNGIKATTVDCSLFDSHGAVLAHATVTTKNSWMYKKPLAAGDYHWLAEWKGKDGAPKKATRLFRVVSPSDAFTIVAKASAAGDPISRSVILAQNGYTYQSLQMLDRMLSQSPSMKGLHELRDSVAKEAIL